MSSTPLSSGAGASSGQTKLTAQFALNAARRWWKVAAPAGLLFGGIAAAAVFWMFEPTYQARYRLQISQDYIVFPKEQPKDFLGTQTELIKSPLVLQPVISDPEIVRIPEIAAAKDPIAHLMSEIGVRPVGGSQLFDVTYMAANAVDAAKVVNKVVDAYFDLRESQEQKRARQVIDLLEGERLYWAEEVKNRQNKVRSLAAEGTGQQPGLEALDLDAERSSLSAIQVQLALLGAEEAELQVRIKTIEQPAEGSGVPASVIDEAVVRNPQVQALKSRLFDLKSTLKEIEVKVGQAKLPPTYQGLKLQFNTTEAQLKQVTEDVRQQAQLELENALNFRRGDELDQLKLKLTGVQAKVVHLQKEFEAQFAAKMANTKKSSGNVVELEFAKVEVQQAKEVHDLINSRIIRIRTEEPLNPVLPLIPAKPPTLPVQQLPYRNLMMATTAGFGLPFIFAVLWELRLRRVNDAQQLQEHSELEVLGEIASFPARFAKARLHSKRFARGLRMFEESIDSLSTYLVLSQPLGGSVHALAVTSAETREGKTSVASTLALSVAQATSSLTLLIDGDMRSPDVHKLFGIPNEPGLAELLAGQVSFSDAVNKSYGSNVHVLPAGKLTSNPHGLLGNDSFNAVLEEARARYRYIIIDTPPVLAASEALLLAASADAALMCVMRDRSSMDKVARTYARLKGSGANLLGAVLNGVPASYYARTYGDYSYER
ncbi:MAG: polysaccharide biosynthesis tyrosine autokinase [Planctomycetes bacterium]|nr:polysaccharide biosynthesis tyrosine autokinase [Planctomycetota bacterium]